MKTYTVQIMHFVPNFKTVIIQAENVEEAKAKAIADDSDQWRLDWEGAGEDEIDGIWEGEEAWTGDNLFSETGAN